MVWVGPRGSALQEDFAMYYQKRAQLDGDCFAKIDSESNQLQELQRIASCRKLYVDEDALKVPEAVLPLLAPQARSGGLNIKRVATSSVLSHGTPASCLQVLALAFSVSLCLSHCQEAS